MKILSISLLAIALVLYVAGCGFLYFKQEALFFYPQKLLATLKEGDQLLPIQGGKHNGLLDTPQYQRLISQIL